ncbi:ATPase [Xylariaceae sp. FL0016]|nr:ATPase [Xylariaceae sp. FL0016]
MSKDGGSSDDGTARTWFDHSSGTRIHTDTLMAKTLSAQYPDLDLVIASQGPVNLLAYAQAGHARLQPIEPEPGSALPMPLSWTNYLAPARRIDGDPGTLVDQLNFGKFIYRWRGDEFLLYVVDCRDGTQAYSKLTNQYVLASNRSRADALLLAAGRWGTELHEQILVFDQGYWQKSAELYRSVMKASWDNVILDPAMKKAIIEDHVSFYESRDTYESLQIPWKRGIIYHGPPGNGKTISIKATMHMLYQRKEPIPTLYVRSLTSYGGPEYALKLIFERARQFAPCYLVFEDLDSIVSDNVRSYFLNEVDGLKNNDGVFMKRPSRFDRKYFFPDPNLEQRIAYCEFWQAKLSSNKVIDFPNKLCTAIAGITDKFSFAYMQEAFVAALLAIARNSNGKETVCPEDIDGDWVDICASRIEDEDLDDLVLWVEIKKQIIILREGMDEEAVFRKFVILDYAFAAYTRF